MATSPAPEPLPPATEPLMAVPEVASVDAELRGAPDRRRTAAPADTAWRDAAAIDRRRSMKVLQGGEQRADRAAGDKRQVPNAARRESTGHAARRDLPPPAEVAREVAIALFEVEAGYRSAAQLERLFTPELWGRLEPRVRRQGGPLPSGRKLIRVHYQELTPGVADTVAVVERGPRVQPVAMRLDARGGRWLVTELRY